jgi:hypothetical protein
MIFYRLHVHDNYDESRGYLFFTTRKEAESSHRTHKKLFPEGEQELDEITVTPTKAGILAALNKYADHPNNG